jgi:hypothetical protein
MEIYPGSEISRLQVINFGHTEPYSSDKGYQSRSDVVVEINLDLKLVSTSQSVKNLK